MWFVEFLFRLWGVARNRARDRFAGEEEEEIEDELEEDEEDEEIHGG